MAAKSVSEIDAIREHGILSAMAGAPFLLVFACVWIAAGGLSFWVPRDIAPWIYVCLGMPAAPIAVALERRAGYLPAPDPDPLFPLAMQLLFVQIVAFPAILLVWESSPDYVPVAMAAIVGAHFLPYQWLYRTRLFALLGIVVSVGAFGLAVLVGRLALHYTGFFVGAVLLIGAWAARAHARSTWRAAAPARQGSVSGSGVIPG